MKPHERAPAAIQGTFSDLKTVKTRSVVQMVIEIPIEQGAQIIDAFGFPRPGEEVPVAVARLDPEKVQHAPAAPETPEKRHWDELSYAEQAGIRCNDPQFWKFLRDYDVDGWKTSLHDTEFLYRKLAVDGHGPSYPFAAGEYVRRYCGDISTRALLNENEDAGKAWANFDTEFQEWAGQRAEQR